jgi:hypothetical protein
MYLISILTITVNVLLCGKWKNNLFGVDTKPCQPYWMLVLNCPLVAHYMKKSKVKCILVQALRLCTGRTAYGGSRGIALLFHDHGTRRGWGVSITPRPLFTPGKDPVPIVQEARWTPGPVWTGAENLAPVGIRSLDRPAHSQSLYWLSYPAHTLQEGKVSYLFTFIC